PRYRRRRRRRTRRRFRTALQRGALAMKATWKSLAHCALLLASLAGGALRAEPYFAVREGLKCMSCHFSETGGGMRNAFGAAWAQTALPRKTIEAPPGELWTGSINRFISVGANLRAR